MTDPDWKALDDFAAGIDGNRLPRTEKLAGCTLEIAGQLHLAFESADKV
ncbi:MAG: MoaF N-terminal domain-containing protein, partial [Stackebrandtia sp.]